jgi:hypothetical protein
VVLEALVRALAVAIAGNERGVAGVAAEEAARCGAITHVGFNLIYLVPGETVGKETYALGLIEALGRAAPLDTRLTAALLGRRAMTARTGRRSRSGAATIRR